MSDETPNESPNPPDDGPGVEGGAPPPPPDDGPEVVGPPLAEFVLPDDGGEIPRGLMNIIDALTPGGPGPFDNAEHPFFDPDGNDIISALMGVPNDALLRVDVRNEALAAFLRTGDEAELSRALRVLTPSDLADPTDNVDSGLRERFAQAQANFDTQTAAAGDSDQLSEEFRNLRRALHTIRGEATNGFGELTPADSAARARALAALRSIGQGLLDAAPAVSGAPRPQYQPTYLSEPERIYTVRQQALGRFLAGGDESDLLAALPLDGPASRGVATTTAERFFNGMLEEVLGAETRTFQRGTTGGGDYSETDGLAETPTPTLVDALRQLQLEQMGQVRPTPEGRELRERALQSLERIGQHVLHEVPGPLVGASGRQDYRPALERGPGAERTSAQRYVDAVAQGMEFTDSPRLGMLRERLVADVRSGRSDPLGVALVSGTAPPNVGALTERERQQLLSAAEHLRYGDGGFVRASQRMRGFYPTGKGNIGDFGIRQDRAAMIEAFGLGGVPDVSATETSWLPASAFGLQSTQSHLSREEGWGEVIDSLLRETGHFKSSHAAQEADESAVRGNARGFRFTGEPGANRAGPPGAQGGGWTTPSPMQYPEGGGPENYSYRGVPEPGRRVTPEQAAAMQADAAAREQRRNAQRARRGPIGLTAGPSAGEGPWPGPADDTPEGPSTPGGGGSGQPSPSGTDSPAGGQPSGSYQQGQGGRSQGQNPASGPTGRAHGTGSPGDQEGPGDGTSGPNPPGGDHPNGPSGGPGGGGGPRRPRGGPRTGPGGGGAPLPTPSGLTGGSGRGDSGPSPRPGGPSGSGPSPSGAPADSSGGPASGPTPRRRRGGVFGRGGGRPLSDATPASPAIPGTPQPSGMLGRRRNWVRRPSLSAAPAARRARINPASPASPTTTVRPSVTNPPTRSNVILQGPSGDGKTGPATAPASGRSGTPVGGRGGRAERSGRSLGAETSGRQAPMSGQRPDGRSGGGRTMPAGRSAPTVRFSPGGAAAPGAS